MKSNFEVNEDSELTTRGFITMHEAQLQQEGEEEIKTLFRIVSNTSINIRINGTGTTVLGRPGVFLVA